MSLLPDSITGYDVGNAEAAQAADARLQQLNQQTYGPGYKPKDTQRYDPDRQRAEIDKTFTDTLSERANAIIGTPLRILGKALGATLWAIPVWVWLLAGGVAFFYLGGGTILRSKLVKKFA